METTNFTLNYRQWNLPEGAKARFGEDAINDIQFSPNGAQMAVARGISIMIYDAFTGTEISLLTGHTAPVNSIVYTAYDSTLISYARDGTIRLWDLTKGKRKITLYEITDTSIYSEAASFSPDGQLFAYISFGCDSIELWDIEKFTLSKTLDNISWRLREFNGPNLNIISGENAFIDPVFSPDGCTLSVGQVSLTQRGTETDTLIHFWDFVKDSPLKTLRLQGMTSSMVFSPDGSMFALACVSGIELYTNTIKSKVKTFIEYKGRVNTLTFSADSRTLAAGCSETLGGGSKISTIYLWDVATGNQLKTFTGFNRRSDSYIGHTGEISSLCFSPVGCTLASGCRDGVALLWDVVPETNRTTITAKETQFDANEINAIAQQAAYEDEQYILENEQPIEASNTLELSADEQGFYDTLYSGTGTKIAIDSQVNVNESKHIYVQRPYQIQQFCEGRRIKTLIHFTRIENLFTILQQGLIDRSHLEASEQQFLFNDSDRADGHPDANCLSISFPNYQMFYSIREQKKSDGINDSQWVVLLLDAKLLWELDCAFCQRNAASNAVNTIPLDERKKPEALKGMFSDFYSIKRQDLKIPKNYPTHPQAEILVFDQIPTEYINAIHFSDATALKDWRSNYIGPFSDKLFADTMYFTYRSDYKVWNRENFDDDGLTLPDTNIDSDLEFSEIDDDIPF